MTRLIPPVCLAIIAIALRGIWPTVLAFVHSFPAWLWGDAGVLTLFFILALSTAAAWALVWVMRVQEALKKWK